MTTTNGPPPENMLKATPVLRVLISLIPRMRSISSKREISPAHDRLADLIGHDDRHRDERGAQRRPPRAHGAIRLTMSRPPIVSTRIATIGLKSIGPNCRPRRRKIRRYGFGDVAQEVQHRVQRARVRHAHAEGEDPGHDDRGEDDQRVDADQRRQEVGDLLARLHQAPGRSGRADMTRRAAVESSDWLKKPFSISAARSSAETSTLRGVSRKTLSAIRCMPPSSA